MLSLDAVSLSLTGIRFLLGHLVLFRTSRLTLARASLAYLCNDICFPHGLDRVMAGLSDFVLALRFNFKWFGQQLGNRGCNTRAHHD